MGSAFRARLLRTLQQLKQQATTCEPTITVVSLDGSSVRVPVKMRFVHAIGEDGNVPEIERCSVLDLKRKLQRSQAMRRLRRAFTWLQDLVASRVVRSSRTTLSSKQYSPATVIAAKARAAVASCILS